MSGERTVLAGDSGGSAARLVHATAKLETAGLGPHALVGGLAVMCRLAAVHRVTQDIDTVTETTTPSALEVIASSVGSPDPSSPYDRVGAIADALAAAPFGLGGLVGDALRIRIVEQPERAVRWLLEGGPEMGRVTPEDLIDVIGPLVGRLPA